MYFGYYNMVCVYQFYDNDGKETVKEVSILDGDMPISNKKAYERVFLDLFCEFRNTKSKIHDEMILSKADPDKGVMKFIFQDSHTLKEETYIMCKRKKVKEVFRKMTE